MEDTDIKNSDHTLDSQRPPEIIGSPRALSVNPWSRSAGGWISKKCEKGVTLHVLDGFNAFGEDCDYETAM